MAYMQTSEQVVSMIAVGTLVDEQGIVASGGYLVQLLPEVGRGPLMVMTERLRDWESIDAHLKSDEFSPSWLLDQLLYGMPFTRLEESKSASIAGATSSGWSRRSPPWVAAISSTS